MLAKRITSRGGLARQRQYIGKLMRDVDAAPIEAALDARVHQARLRAEKHKRLESWRARLLEEGPAALDELVKWCPAADRKSLQALIAKATVHARRFRQSRCGLARAVPRHSQLVGSFFVTRAALEDSISR